MNLKFPILTFAAAGIFFACSGTSSQAKGNAGAASLPVDSTSSKSPESPVSPKDEIPASYKDIVYPEFQYKAPYPADSRIKISDSITGYVIEDRTLPLVHFNIFFPENFIVNSPEDEAAHDLLSSMFRRGGSSKISPEALDDSLEFIAASLAGSVGTFTSLISIECLSKDFPQLLSLAKDVFLDPGFDEKALEIQKSAAANAYEHRFDTPSAILSALERRVSYGPNPRLWTATADEYRKVTRDNLKRLAKGRFRSGRIVFALAGDFSRDSMVAALKPYFESWPSDFKNEAKIPQLSLRKTPGIYVVDKEVSQANISMTAPFVKRPDPEYYPAAVASFILGGGSFSSRLMARVRSDNGLAYSIHSHVDNDYRDSGLVTIRLQTKVESAAEAIRLIREEIQKLSKEGPTGSELSQAKKTLVESLPSLFDSPASTTVLFAQGELLGKKDSHYIDYVKEIEAVSGEQVKQMIAKYFDPDKLTISIVGPAEKLGNVGKFTLVPIDSLDFRK